MNFDDFQPVFSDRSEWSLPHALRRCVERHPDKVFLEFPERELSYTFGESLRLAEHIAANLLRSYAEVGDRVLVMAPNSPDVVLAWFGTNLGGLVHVPINTAYQGPFLEHQVSLAAPAAAIVHADYADRFMASREACSSIRHMFVVGEGAALERALATLSRGPWSAAPFADLLEPAAAELPETVARRLANIYFTSGTTGLSKGVMMSYAQVHLFGEEMVAITGLTGDDVYMNAAPMFHGNTPFMALTPCLIVGARLVLYEKFSPGAWLGRVRESGATHTNLVGVMMEWVTAQERSPHDADHRLRCVCSVPTPADLVGRFKERFGVERVVDVYGSTESSLPVVTPPGVQPPPGACGLLVSDYYDVRLVDPDTDEEVPVGAMGELIVRPRHPWTICLGYWGMPDKTAEAFRNLWFHTGDGLRRDADGWFYFVDRLKDAIRRRGENISSFELEQALLAHPSIVECAVIAVPADAPGAEDEVMAFIVPAEGREVTADDLWEWADDHLPRFVVPRYVSVVDGLPKTPSERVKKAELRRIAGELPRADRHAVTGSVRRVG